MFHRLRVTLSRFMAGRYGTDSLNKFLLICYIVLVLVGMIVSKAVGGLAYFICYVLELALFLVILFRMLSRNIYKRQQENIKYLELKQKFTRFWNLRREMFRTRKTNVWRKCPNCKAVIKLPRKKGRHICTCPKCRKDFPVKV